MQNNRSRHPIPGANHREKLPQLLQKLLKSRTLVGRVRARVRASSAGVSVAVLGQSRGVGEGCEGVIIVGIVGVRVAAAVTFARACR